MIKTEIDGLIYKVSFHHRRPDPPSSQFKLSKTKSSYILPGTTCVLEVWKGEDKVMECTHICNLSREDHFNYDAGRKYSLAKLLKIHFPLSEGVCQAIDLGDDCQGVMSFSRPIPGNRIIREEIWKAYRRRRTPNPRKILTTLQPKDPNYMAKLHALYGVITSPGATIPVPIKEWAYDNGFKVKEIDTLFSQITI